MTYSHQSRLAAWWWEYVTTFQNALTLLTTVISANQKDHVTVDAGTKSIYLDLNHEPQIINVPHLKYTWGGFGDKHGKVTSISNDIALPKRGTILEQNACAIPFL